MILFFFVENALIKNCFNQKLSTLAVTASCFLPYLVAINKKYLKMRVFGHASFLKNYFADWGQKRSSYPFSN